MLDSESNIVRNTTSNHTDPSTYAQFGQIAIVMVIFGFVKTVADLWWNDHQIAQKKSSIDGVNSK